MKNNENINTEIRDYVAKIKKLVDAHIKNELKDNNKLTEALYKSAVYSTLGGKRVRATFVFLLGRMFDIPEEKLLSTACAIELIHAASLIMDDLPYMDDSQLRRGKPANHIVFGQDVALLASIGLMSQAIQILLKDDKLNDKVKNNAVFILADSFGFNGLAAGQFVDLKLKHKNVEFKIIEFINNKKTAALFSAAATITAVIGNADKKRLKAVQEFSESLGFVFQIIDDILDVIGNEKLVGKNLEHDTANFVSVVGMESAKNYLKKYQKRSLKALEIFGNKAAELSAFSSYLMNRMY